MCPVEKTHAAPDLGVSPHLDDPILLKRLNEQNINKILAEIDGDYTKQDILDHLKFKRDQLFDLLQNYQTVSDTAEPTRPRVEAIPKFDETRTLSDNDLEAFQNMLKLALTETGERRSVPKAGIASMNIKAGVDDELTPEELEAQARASLTYEGTEAAVETTVYGVDTFLDIVEPEIFASQLQMEMEEKTAELEQEIQRILAMVRSGKIDATFLLIALAKVTAAKNGLLFTQMGRRITRLNLESSKIMKDLYASDPNTDPKYAAKLQMTSQQQKEIGQRQQFIMQDMQAASSNIEKAVAFGKNSIDDIFKNRLQIINAIRGN